MVCKNEKEEEKNGKIGHGHVNDQSHTEIRPIKILIRKDGRRKRIPIEGICNWIRAAGHLFYDPRQLIANEREKVWLQRWARIIPVPEPLKNHLSSILANTIFEKQKRNLTNDVSTGTFFTLFCQLGFWKFFFSIIFEVWHLIYLTCKKCLNKVHRKKIILQNFKNYFSSLIKHFFNFEYLTHFYEMYEFLIVLQQCFLEIFFYLKKWGCSKTPSKKFKNIFMKLENLSQSGSIKQFSQVFHPIFDWTFFNKCSITFWEKSFYLKL